MGISGKLLLEVARPALEKGDARVLARAVGQHWNPIELGRFLRHPDVDVRRVAAAALGVVGDRRVVGPLAEALRDADAQVHEMAEHALWHIWFRSCGRGACRPFREGMALMEAEAYARAASRFREAAGLDPDFAEARHQCALAHFFLAQWERVIACCEEALARMPEHFGALSFLGHAYTELGDTPRALTCYRRALGINPRMHAVAKTIERLEERQRRQNDASGVFEVRALGA